MTDTAAETITDVEVLPPEQAVAILTDEAKAEAFFAKVSAEVRAHVPDLSDTAGRKAIASIAYKVARTKAAIDKARLAQTKEWREQIAAANAAGAKLIDRFDELQAEVRKPLTEWEDAEKAKADNAQAVLNRIKEAAVITIDDTAEGVTARLVEIEGLEIDETFGDYEAIAKAERERAITALTAGAERLAEQERQAAELERLRKEREEREAADAAEAAAKDEARVAELARTQRIERTVSRIKECAEGKIAGRPVGWGIILHELEANITIADDFAEHAETARALLASTIENVRTKVAEEKAEAERIAQEQAERAAADAAAKAKAEAEAEEKRKAEEERQAAERREANRRHASKVLREAKEAIMLVGEGVEETVAVWVVQAIREGKIPRVTLTF